MDINVKTVIFLLCCSWCVGAGFPILTDSASPVCRVSVTESPRGPMRCVVVKLPRPRLPRSRDFPSWSSLYFITPVKPPKWSLNLKQKAPRAKRRQYCAIMIAGALGRLWTPDLKHWPIWCLETLYYGTKPSQLSNAAPWGTRKQTGYIVA